MEEDMFGEVLTKSTKYFSRLTKVYSTLYCVKEWF
jgi:hypothetical protein